MIRGYRHLTVSTFNIKGTDKIGFSNLLDNIINVTKWVRITQTMFIEINGKANTIFSMFTFQNTNNSDLDL